MLRKITLSLLIPIFSITLAYSADETLTITTYYPSPYGVYRDLRVTENLLLEREPINTDGAQIEWRTSANNAGWHWNIDQYAYDTPLDEPRLRFYIENPTLGTNSEKLTLLQNGNVGIGITTPEARLDIGGSGTLKLGINSSDPSSAPVGAVYYNNSTNTIRVNASGGWKNVGGTPRFVSGRYDFGTVCNASATINTGLTRVDFAFAAILSDSWASDWAIQRISGITWSGGNITISKGCSNKAGALSVNWFAVGE